MQDKHYSAEKFMLMVESMPAFPESVHQVISLSSDINCPAKKLVRVIESDPVLTMKILKLANSAYFALSGNIASIQHALVYLGLNTVKNLALSIATVEALPRQGLAELSMSHFLIHSLATASVAQQFARDFLHIKNHSDYFIAGLLHDFGKTVFVQFEPEMYAKVLFEARSRHCPLIEVEQEVFGMTNAELGAMLAQRWQLPQALVESIRLHVDCDESSSDLTMAVAAANTVVKFIGLGDSGNPCVGDFPAFMSQRLGSDLETTAAQMDALPETVQGLQAMVQA